MALLKSGGSGIEVTLDGAIEAFEHAGTRVEVAYSSIGVAGTIIEPHLCTPTGSFGFRFLAPGLRGWIRFSPAADGIDAVHCDASDYEANRRFFTELRERLPGAAIGGEHFATLSAYGCLDFSQCWRSQSLIEHDDSFEAGTDYHQLLPDPSALAGLLAWLDKASPLSGLTDPFTRVYPHLCHADAFVPAAKVCTCSGPVSSPIDPARLRRILEDAGRLGYIPGLRVNYRDYGLDEQTGAYSRSLAAKNGGEHG